MFPIAANSDDETLYSDSVFSTYLYTGNGSTQTITNGIDLAGKGGMVWIKQRSNVGFYVDHVLSNTAQGVNTVRSSNLTDDPGSGAVLSAFNSNGFGVVASDFSNKIAGTYASWTFRKAAKFFDVVTYTGTGSAQTIAHSLGVAPGMIIVKRTDTSGYSWVVWNRGLSTNNSLKLNTTDGEILSAAYIPTAGVTSTSFQVGGGSLTSDPGTYVAYIFAHDTSSTGIIQCGSCTINVGSETTVNLGWEPQWVLMKRTNGVGGWFLFDTMRGMTVSGATAYLYANSTAVEDVSTAGGTTYLVPTATGFATNGFLTAGNYIYMAIRRPNKPPTTGTQVFAPISNTSPTTGNLTDLTINRQPTGLQSTWAISRLTNAGLETQSTNVETATSTYIKFDVMTGVTNSGWISNAASIWWNFKRAPGFFDEVCYTGTSIATTQAHNLGVAPELIIVKQRSAPARNWIVGNTPSGWNKYLRFNTTDEIVTQADLWNDTSPNSSVFTLGTSVATNGSGFTYVAYLFATLAGISKVGSYTGNGGTQNIECGFAAGARFVLIKRTDAAGDWYTWDTARGIVTGNDPHLSLNTTAAEVTTDDSIDPYSPGFTVNQVAATNINVTSATYIFLAIS